MNLREKKVLTTAERNQLVNEFGPLQITTLASTEEMPKVTQLTDKTGFTTSHFMIQDLFEWEYGNEIGGLPADSPVPFGPAYKITYSTAYGQAPAYRNFQLTDGIYYLKEEDLPNLVVDKCVFDGWMLNGVKAKVGDEVTGNIELVANIKEQIKVGDILYSDGTYSTVLDTMKTPVALALSPTEVEGEWMFVSLVNMSLEDPENGTDAEGNNTWDPEDPENTNPGAGIVWGNKVQVGDLVEGSFPGLVYDDEEKDYFIQNHIVSSNGGTIPSDVEQPGVLYPFITGMKYYKGNSNYSPSPLNADGARNPLYNNPTFTYLDGEEEVTEDNNCAAQSGFSKTAIIVEAATSTETTGEIENSSEEGHFPAAMACYRFNAGVPSLTHQWYLPEVGELGFLMAPLTKLNQQISIIKEAGFAAVCIGDIHTQNTLGIYLWSSSESSSGDARTLGTYNGGLDGNDGKDRQSSYFRVRAFLRLTPTI